MSSKTFASSGGVGGQFATGTYTGDGAATQAIIGVGFQPRFVVIYSQTDPYPVHDPAMKTDQDGAFAIRNKATNRWRYQIDHIISLDADGFTVGDGTGSDNSLNINGIDYVYVAFR